MRSGGCGEIGYLVIKRDRADFAAVFDGSGAFGRVHHQIDSAILHEVDNIWTAFVDLFGRVAGNAVIGKKGSSASGGDDGESQFPENLRCLYQLISLVGVLDRKE